MRLAHFRIGDSWTRVESLGSKLRVEVNKRTHPSVGARACLDERVSEKVGGAKPVSWVADKKRADEVF